MLRASFIPSRPQRQLRDLIRYRRTLTQERTRESSAPRNSRRRPDQAVGGDQRHLRRLRPGHARRPDRPARRDPRRRYHRRPGHHRRDRHRHDPLSHPGHLVSWAKFAPRARQSADRAKTATAARATPGPAVPSAKPPPAPPGPRPSWPPATSGSSSAATRTAPWSPSATPSSPSPGTCCPTRPRISPTWAPAGTTAWHRCAASASSSPNSSGYQARKSPSRTPSDLTPPPGHTPGKPGSANAPPGAAACPLTDRFSIQHRYREFRWRLGSTVAAVDCDLA